MKIQYEVDSAACHRRLLYHAQRGWRVQASRIYAYASTYRFTDRGVVY
jgi:hypothetical protein